MNYVMLTDRQEKFAQLVASGVTHSDAYRGSYQTKNMKIETVWNNAYKLANNNEVKARIEDIKDRVIEKVVKNFAKSKEEILYELEEIKCVAKASGDLKEVRECLKEQGSLLGYYIKKVESKDTSLQEKWLAELENTNK